MKVEVRAKQWADVVVGKRELHVSGGCVSVFPKGKHSKSIAGWLETSVPVDDRPAYLSHVTYALKFPAELKALIRGVLKEGHPIEPLVDWVIEFGPENLSHELQAMVAKR